MCSTCRPKHRRGPQLKQNKPRRKKNIYLAIFDQTQQNTRLTLQFPGNHEHLGKNPKKNGAEGEDGLRFGGRATHSATDRAANRHKTNDDTKNRKNDHLEKTQQNKSLTPHFPGNHDHLGKNPKKHGTVGEDELRFGGRAAHPATERAANQHKTNDDTKKRKNDHLDKTQQNKSFTPHFPGNHDHLGKNPKIPILMRARFPLSA